MFTGKTMIILLTVGLTKKQYKWVNTSLNSGLWGNKKIELDLSNQKQI